MNYQKILEETISNLDNSQGKASLLLHVCCGPCSTYVIECLAEYFDISLYFYNPNLDSKEEFQRRADELLILAKNMPEAKKIRIIYEEYKPEEFLKIAKDLEDETEGGKRCMLCYNQRLEKTARFAKDNDFDYFTTTLSISPYKNARALNSIGKRLEKKYRIKYLYADFKKKAGYQRSVELSKDYNLYRQDYCGCIYSKKERDDASNKS